MNNEETKIYSDRQINFLVCFSNLLIKVLK